jgi:hypothetical protein
VEQWVRRGSSYQGREKVKVLKVEMDRREANSLAGMEALCDQS